MKTEILSRTPQCLLSVVTAVSLLLVVVTAQAPAAQAGADSSETDLPQAHPLNRYSTLWERSPFVLEVIVNEPAPIASAFDGLSVVGVFSSGDLQMVTLYHQEKNERYVVTNRPQPGDEFVLENMTSGQDLDSTSITLRTASGTETGTIRGSTSAVKTMKNKQPAPPRNAAPNVPDPNAVRKPSIPTPQAQNAGNAQNAQNDGKEDDNRRRRRVIRPRQIPASQ